MSVQYINKQYNHSFNKICNKVNMINYHKYFSSVYTWTKAYSTSKIIRKLSLLQKFIKSKSFNITPLF